MSCLQVLTPGMLTTVQDLGRTGYAHLGVSASGAADPLSLRLGNLLLGNDEGLAALELTMTGGSYRFPEGATFALTGSDFVGKLNGNPAPLWRTTVAPHNSVLQLGSSRTGARGYLCVRGGIRVPLFLGSASTHLLSGLGGVAGRALRTGDLLRVGREPGTAVKCAIRGEALARTAPSLTLRITPGTHASRFSETIRTLFTDSTYAVTEQVNRMGLRLRGPAIYTSDSAGVLSQGVSCGSIQVTNAGQPLILFVEQQTTGGYPLIASVISADLPSIGQLRPGDVVRFEVVSTQDALRLLKQREQWVASGELFD